MRTIQVEFLQRPSVRPALGYALAGSLMLLAFTELRLAFDWRQSALVLERRVADHRIGSQPQAPSDPGPVGQPEPAYARDAFVVLKTAEYDVSQVLAALEAVQVAGVKVLALEIASVERSAIVELELQQDPGALHEYLGQLNVGLEAGQRWQLRRTQLKGAGNEGAATIFASPTLVDRPIQPVPGSLAPR